MAACHGRGHRNEHRGVQRNGADHGTTGMAAVRGLRKRMAGAGRTFEWHRAVHSTCLALGLPSGTVNILRAYARPHLHDAFLGDFN